MLNTSDYARVAARAQSTAKLTKRGLQWAPRIGLLITELPRGLEVGLDEKSGEAVKKHKNFRDMGQLTVRKRLACFIPEVLIKNGARHFIARAAAKEPLL